MIDLLKQYDDHFILVPENLDFTLMLAPLQRPAEACLSLIISGSGS